MRATGTSQFGTQLGKIRSSLKQQILSGIMSEGQKLPSERELSELFSTTRITIKDQQRNNLFASGLINECHLRHRSNRKITR